MGENGTVLLYSYFRSSCSYRVRIALAHKGIGYEYRAVNLLSREQRGDSFVKLNPSAKVPVLVHEGNVLTQSNAILEYLEEVVPEPPLLPKDDPAGRAAVRGIVDCIVSDIQPLQNVSVLAALPEETKRTWAKTWIEKGFEAVEELLRKTHGKYCFGDNLTLADVCLVPQVYNAGRFEVDVTQFPLIHEISSRLSELPAFKAAHPHEQPDCPPELRR